MATARGGGPDNEGMSPKHLVKKHFPLAAGPAGGLSAAVVVLYLLAYVGLDRLSFIHPMRGLNITPWNPQAALAVALLLWRPSAWWAVWLGLLASEFALPGEAGPWLAELSSSAAWTAGYAMTAAALSRWLGPMPAGPTRRHLLVFLSIVVLGTLLNAVLYVAVLALFGVTSPQRMAAAIFRGWIGDAVGLVVTLPLLLGLSSGPRRTQSLAMLGEVEWWAVALTTIACTYAVFAQPAEEQFKYFYLLFLPAVWAAARFGVTGAVWSAALIQVLLIAAVQSMSYRSLTVFEFQVLMAVLAATGLLLGVTVDEREEADRALRASLHVVAAGDMAAALAHELNQPLTALSTFARASQLMIGRLKDERPDLAEPLIHVADRLVDEANRASGVVTRLRNFFRDRTTELQPADVASLLDEVMRSQEARAASLGIRVEWRAEPGMPRVWLDRVQIAVVLRNLVANAMEAASQAPADGRWVSVHASAAVEHVRVAVLDGGPGVAAEQLPGFFDSQRGSSKPGGMGIGLGLSRAILEAHGGRLWAEPGPGGKFFFNLPVPALHSHE